MDKFMYLCYTNDNELYINLTKLLLESILSFSKNKILVFLVRCKKKERFPEYISNEQIIFHEITAELPSIYYYKPLVINEAIYMGVKYGVYIDVDNLITPHCDNLEFVARSLGNMPIAPMHPKIDHKPSEQMMQFFGVKKTQHYIHASCIVFNESCKSFVQQWYNACLLIEGENWDETVLNCLFWKLECKEHYIPIIDPWYKNFYKSGNPPWKYFACMFHGCKDIFKQTTLLKKMKLFYDSYRIV